MPMISYGFVKTLDEPFEAVEEKVRKELQKEGFGILTEIDVKTKFREKLGIDFKKYKILGACSPPNAHEAILAEENVGLLLPCNVIVYEKDGKTNLSVIKPTVAMQMVDNPKMERIAEKIEKSLKRAFDAV
jgi:uncharacterized protein (DUF302 family)